MRFRQGLTILAIVTIAGTVGATPGQAQSSATSASPKWHSNLESAREKAAQLNTPILLHFYADWCGPCRRMDRQVLHSTELLDRLGNGVIGVKVDCDRHQDLVRKYNVRALPSDVVIDGDGQVLARSDGYQEKRAYLARLDRAVAEFRLANPTVRVAERTPSETPSNSKPPTIPASEAALGNSTPNLAADAKEPSDDTPFAEKRPSQLGLEGYSPVSLAHRRKWRKGSTEFTVEHKGVVYQLASAEEQAEFRADPERFAPCLMGYDPVILLESQRVVPGSISYGAYYDGSLYLFSTRESRQQFKDDPPRYLKIQQALRLDHIDRNPL